MDCDVGVCLFGDLGGRSDSSRPDRALSNMSTAPTLLWFRQDLRLEDNPALSAAAARGGVVVAVYIWDPEGEGSWAPGAASRWWLHHSLTALDAALRRAGSRLLVRSGASERVLGELLAATGADAVYWNRRYEPAAIARDAAIKSGLKARGVDARSFNASLLFEPTGVKNRQGGPFQVFTPYWRHCLSLEVERPAAAARPDWMPVSRLPVADALESLGLLPTLDWAAAFGRTWVPGEDGARKALEAFVAARVDTYATDRDFPSLGASSRLSAALHFGEIGPRQIWERLRARNEETGVFPASVGESRFLAEVGWREFAYHLLFHFPRTPEAPLRGEYAAFPWADDPEGKLLRAWRRGRTGYPIVDAGMRELWTTGWMHNRVRMIVASFLVKHLRLPWQEGARWFWDTLVDADLASNTLGWQWSAGCGADAAPYFRIFNPVLQGEKFDAEGRYVKTWIPELARLPASCIHRPWEADPGTLASAGVELGRTYPRPIVDHVRARQAALAALQALKERPS